MSAVLLKKIRSAGGIPPSLLKCEPIWSGLQSACEHWGKASFGGDLVATVVQKALVSGRELQSLVSERFAYICLPYPRDGLRMVAIDKASAIRYASLRLKQTTDELSSAPPLFLRLMCDHPARTLWKQIHEAVPVGYLPDDFSVMDPAGMADSLEPDARLLKVAISLVDSGESEDGWLLDGGEELPELHLYYDLTSLVGYAGGLEAKASNKKKHGSPSNQESLRRNMRSSTIQLNAVLERISLTLADCSRLEIGQVIALPDVEPSVVSVCADTMHGSVAISKAELGTWKGKRALKLVSPVLESFAHEIAEI